MKQKITSFLWFDGRAEEAASFYTGIFPRSRVVNVTRCGDHGPGPKGSALTVVFELDGQEFIALNGGPMFRFTEAVPFSIDCADQAEVDHYWDKLTSGGGSPSRCGWLKDKFGVSWQVIPTVLGQLIGDKDDLKAGRAVQAMLQMNKLDIARLQAAHAGK